MKHNRVELFYSFSRSFGDLEAVNLKKVGIFIIGLGIFFND